MHGKHAFTEDAVDGCCLTVKSKGGKELHLEADTNKTRDAFFLALARLLSSRRQAVGPHAPLLQAVTPAIDGALPAGEEDQTVMI